METLSAQFYCELKTTLRNKIQSKKCTTSIIRINITKREKKCLGNWRSSKSGVCHLRRQAAGWGWGQAGRGQGTPGAGAPGVCLRALPPTRKAAPHTPQGAGPWRTEHSDARMHTHARTHGHAHGSLLFSPSRAHTSFLTLTEGKLCPDRKLPPDAPLETLLGDSWLQSLVRKALWGVPPMFMRL